MESMKMMGFAKMFWIITFPHCFGKSDLDSEIRLRD